MSVIEDGTGTGMQMKVDSDKRAHTQSLSIPYDDFAVLDGNSFGVVTPVVTLTSANISYLLYVDNTNSHDLVVSNAIMNMGVSTGGANTDWLFTIHINPTGGTLISGGSVAFPINNNLGSANVLDVTALSGVEGSTATGGLSANQLIQGPSGFALGQKFVVPAGSSFAIGATPPASNTSVSAQLGVTLIKQTLDFK